MANEKNMDCPFCGGDNLQNLTDDGTAWTACRSCGATGPLLVKRQEDGPDWNTRAVAARSEPQDVAGLVEAVEAFLSADREALANHGPKGGLADAVDNAGTAYQSHFLADALTKARQVLAAFQSRQEGK